MRTRQNSEKNGLNILKAAPSKSLHGGHGYSGLLQRGGTRSSKNMMQMIKSRPSYAELIETRQIDQKSESRLILRQRFESCRVNKKMLLFLS